MNNNEIRIEVPMGEALFLDTDSKEYLYTTGLGPCVGVAIVIRDSNKKVYRLLGHIAMDEINGESFSNLKNGLDEIKNLLRTT